MVLPAAGGGTCGHGYWVQPFGDGRTGFLQPVWLAVREKAHIMMLHRFFLLAFFWWLIHVDALSDPVIIVYCYYCYGVTYFNKKPVCINQLMQRQGHPISKKNKEGSLCYRHVSCDSNSRAALWFG